MYVLQFLCFLTVIAAGGAKKLNIDIFYESLCPDSLKFIKNQLYPAYGEIAPYVNIKFIPFGKSTSNGGTQFFCQHGPKECIGNRLQSCTLHSLPDQNAKVDYVNCFMETFKKLDSEGDEYGQSCLTNVGLGWDVVKQCYETGLGTQLQLQAEVDTAQYSPRFIPTIVYNGVFDQQLQSDSLQDFRNVVCNLLSESYPQACKDRSAVQLL